MYWGILDIVPLWTDLPNISGWHWYKDFLVLAIGIFISSITSIVVNQKYFKISFTLLGLLLK